MNSQPTAKVMIRSRLFLSKPNGNPMTLKASAESSANQYARNKAIKKLLKDVLYNSLAQTVIRIVLTPYKILKLFLIVCVLCSIALASYLVIHSIIEYYTYGVYTTTRTIYETPTLFPKVTFCNINPFTTEYAYNLYRNGIYYGNDLSNEEKQKLAHDLDDILIECWFNKNSPCTASDFTWSYDEVYGNCYTFNSGFDSNGSRVDLKESNMAGPYFGLHLTLYVNIYEKLIDFEKILGLGAIIRIGNSSYSMYDSNNGILVPSGFQTNIAIEREFKSTLPKPYSNCEINSNSPRFMSGLDLYNLIGQTDYAYSQQLCFSQCIQKKSIDKYNCTLFYLVSLFNKTQCSTHNDQDFIFSSADSFDSSFIDKTCLSVCPLECNQTFYKASVSSSRLIRKNSYISYLNQHPNVLPDFINKTIDSSLARESIASVNVYYESLGYKESTESLYSEMDLVSLFASIGGSLSLFLGVSVFSICEIIEVALEMYFIIKNGIKFNSSNA
jgi:hypothetical protein